MNNAPKTMRRKSRNESPKSRPRRTHSAEPKRSTTAITAKKQNAVGEPLSSGTPKRRSRSSRPMPSRRTSDQLPEAEERSYLRSKKDVGLLGLFQVAGTTHVPPGTDERLKNELIDGSVELFWASGPEDAIDSMLLRLLVGLNNAAMTCLGRAASEAESLQARDLELRHGTKAAKVAADLVRVFDDRHNRGTPNVRQVNVHSGGRAIVGNVSQVEKTADPSDATERRDDED